MKKRLQEIKGLRAGLELIEYNTPMVYLNKDKKSITEVELKKSLKYSYYCFFINSVEVVRDVEVYLYNCINGITQ